MTDRKDGQTGGKPGWKCSNAKRGRFDSFALHYFLFQFLPPDLPTTISAGGFFKTQKTMSEPIRTITIIKHGHELTLVEVENRPRSNRIDAFGKSHTFETAMPRFNGMENMALRKVRKLSKKELKQLQS